MNNPIPWKKNRGILAAVESAGGTMPNNDKFQWFALIGETPMLILEADHWNKSVYNFKRFKHGIIEKHYPALPEDVPPLTRAHHIRTFDVSRDAYLEDRPVRVLLTRNNRNSATPDRPISTAVLDWTFRFAVFEAEGEALDPYWWRLERVL